MKPTCYITLHILEISWNTTYPVSPSHHEETIWKITPYLLKARSLKRTVPLPQEPGTNALSTNNNWHTLPRQSAHNGISPVSGCISWSPYLLMTSPHNALRALLVNYKINNNTELKIYNKMYISPPIYWPKISATSLLETIQKFYS